MTTARPALDPELRELLGGMPLMTRLDPELLGHLRKLPSTPVESLLAHRQVDRREVSVPAEDGAAIALSVFSPANLDRTAAAPCVYWMHGGGMVMGDRFSQIDIPLEWLDEFGAVVVSVEYRLAPEAAGTTLVDDCYRGLLWIAAHSEELGARPRPDRRRRSQCGRRSRRRCHPDGPRPRRSRDRRADADLPHARPSQHQRLQPSVLRRARRLDPRDERVRLARRPGRPRRRRGVRVCLTGSGRGPVGPAGRLHRHRLSPRSSGDEDTDYASRIWAAGGQAELHVWAGGFHGFDALYPQAGISATARRTRTDWLGRILPAPTPG
ncbi:hypothetical protein SMICM17S_13078 [Streptomyces microflavus]